MNPSDHSPRSPARRAFLGQTAAAAALLAAPRRLRGAAVGPNSRLNIAGIGIGGQGAWDLADAATENIVALCDVDDDYAARTFAAYPQAKRYKDFRVMLEQQKDIDAVIIATPDHLHAVVTMAALKAGKHVYCEKPLTRTVFEARAIARAAAEAKVATQMGNQGMAHESNRVLDRWIAEGVIGPVREVHVWSDRPTQGGKAPLWWPQGIDRPTDTPPVPATLDWDLWLGPAPYRPYHPTYVPFRWRGWWDFGSGGIGDMGIHNLAPVFSALQLGSPTSISASSTAQNGDSVPLASLVQFQYPARGDFPPLTLHWYDGGLLPARPEELGDDDDFDRENGSLFIGDKGKILVLGEGGEFPRILPREKGPPHHNPPSDPTVHARHIAEWIKACKEGTPTRSSFGFASRVTETVLLGAACVRNGGNKLLWDGDNLRFTNDSKANRFVHYDYRPGWIL